MNATTSAAGPVRPLAAPTVWETVRGFPRPVWCLLAGMFINRFGTFVLPFLALHVTGMGYSAWVVGWVVGAFGAGHLAASVIGGHLADTIGPRRTIVASTLCGAVTMLILSQARSLPMLAGLAFLNGLTGEFHRPASSALLASLVPEDRRVTAYAAYRFAMNAGFAIGPAVGGLLAAESFLWLFVGDALTSGLYGLVATFLLPADVLASAPRLQQVWRAGSSLREAITAAWHDVRFRRLAVASFAVAMVFMQMFTTLGLAMEAAGLSRVMYGLVLGLNGGLIVVFEIPATVYTRAQPPRSMLGLGYALIGLGALLLTWAHSIWGFAFAMTVVTAGEIVSMPVAMAYVAGLGAVHMRGRMLGLYGLTWAAAMAVGPAWGGALLAISGTGLWLSCGALGLMGAAVMVVGVRRRAGHEPGDVRESRPPPGSPG
jgi:MFS family permease